MPDPVIPPSAEGDIRIDGPVTVTKGAVAVGKGAQASNVVVESSGETEPGTQGPWWRRVSPWRLLLGAVLAVAAFGVSLWLYPGDWDQSWRTLAALGVASLLGATIFLDAARGAYWR